jgi:tRNA (guanine37-N1)-methyltransferase
MIFDIITIFPHILNSYASESILGRAQKNGLVEINLHDLRKYTSDKHNTVDDTPYGGGVGMVMMVEPLYKAIKDVKDKNKNSIVILMSPKGKRFTQPKARNLTKYDQIILIAGRYEGIDERVNEFVDEQISIGDFILNGGELPAIMITEATTRLLPGVLGKDESSHDESFSEGETLEYPQYTRPEMFTTDEKQELKVPDVLLSGNHGKIDKWKKENTLTK